LYKQLRVVFAGTPEFAVSPLRAILAARHPLVGVLTQPDRPAGRGRRLSASAVQEVALAAQLPIAQPQSLRSDEGRQQLIAWRPDVVVVVAYGLILPPAVLAIPRLGCVNIHASLLPRWRGAAPIQRAIMAGDALTGITIMQMDAGLDSGPMLLAKELLLTRDMDAGSLHAALSLLGAELIIEALDSLAAGSLTAVPQPAAGACYARKIERNEASIDFGLDAAMLERQVRGLAIWPIAETSLRGEQLRIHVALALPDKDLADDALAAAVADARARQLPAGTVLGTVIIPAPLPHAGKAAIAVLCGQGVLALLRLQRSGRKALDAVEFQRGDAVAACLLGGPP
jgi:methionyl-tRNA formyltransferase